MIKKILAAIDLTESCEAIIKRAGLLAKQQSAELYLLHVLPKNIYLELFPKIMSNQNIESLDLEAKANEILLKKINELTKDNINASYRVETGNSSDEILKFIQEEKIDILLLGNRTHSYLKSLFLGSTASNVIRSCTCPIIIIKKEPTQDYQNILVGIDFSEGSQNALQYAAMLFPEKKITVLHVTDPWYEETLLDHKIHRSRTKNLLQAMSYELQNTMKNFIKKIPNYPADAKNEIKTGYPEKVISKEAENNKIDLVVISARGQSKFHYAILGSVANKILHSVEVDILLVPVETEIK